MTPRTPATRARIADLANMAGDEVKLKKTLNAYEETKECVVDEDPVSGEESRRDLGGRGDKVEIGVLREVVVVVVVMDERGK